MYTQQVRYGSVPEWCTHCWCRYCHHTFMCHKCHVKHTDHIHLNNTPKEYKLDSLKSESKGATNETPTCAVPVHAQQTNSLWRGGCEQRV